MGVESGLLITWGLVCACITIAASIYCVHRYAHPDVHWSVKATVAVSWFFSFSVIWMIALDVNPTARTGLGPLWKIMFWAIQIGTWLWCGLQQDYFDAGEFDTKGKIKYSIMINLKILAAAGVVGIIFLVYIAIVNQFTSDDLVGFVVALANTIGLSLLICLLGHGLIEVPRKLWDEASYQIRMKHYLYKLKQVDVDYDQCKEDLVNVCVLIRDVAKKIKSEDELYQQFLIVEGNVPDEKERKAYGISSLGSSTIDRDDKLYERVQDCEKPDLQLLVDINFRARRVTGEMRRVRLTYDVTIDKAIKCEEQLNELNRDPPPEITNRESFTADNVRWYLNSAYGRRFLMMRTVSLFFMFMSICVVWSEVTMFSSSSLSIFGALLASASNAVSTQIYATVPIAYICSCAFYSAFQLKIGKFYHCHDHKQTDFNSLLYNAQLLLRLVVGVGYNYMLILNIKSSAFLDIMGTMNMVPLFGSSFVLYFPILLAFLCVATLMNWWSHLVRCLGVKTFSGNESHNDENMQDGLRLLEIAKRKRAQRKNGDVEDPIEDGILGATLQKTRGMLQMFGIVRDESGAGGQAYTTHLDAAATAETKPKAAVAAPSAAKPAESDVEKGIVEGEKKGFSFF